MKKEAVISHLKNTNEDTYNYLKLGEELAELQEVVLKKLTKTGTAKEPPIEKFIEEMSDVYIRLDILTLKLGIGDDITNYITNKLEGKYATFIKEGKYIGRL